MCYTMIVVNKIRGRKMTKLILKFINKGKPFELKNWTVMKHKAVLEKINKLPKNTSESDKDIEFQFLCIYEGLKEVDPNLELDNIRQLHPTVLVELFNAIYTEGKCDIYFREKGKKTKSK